MKKIFILAVLLFTAFSLTSCFSAVDEIEIVSVPKLEFEQNETFTLEQFIGGLSLKVNSTAVTQAQVKSYASISGFDLTQDPGIYKATVSYIEGSTSGTVSFMYTIKAAGNTYGFAAYDANSKTYYISNVNQFRNIVLGQYPDKNDETAKFVLLNDIDFENTSPWIGFVDKFEEQNGYVFKGTFDGNDKVMKNLNSTLIAKLTFSITGSLVLFGRCGNAEFKNINLENFVYNNPISKGVGLLSAGSSSGNNGDTIKLTNINTNSGCKVTGGNNVGGLIGYGRCKAVIAKNCTLNTHVTSSTSSAGGIAGSCSNIGTLYAESCINNGYVEASEYTGSFYGYVGSPSQVTIKECTNNATIVIKMPSINGYYISVFCGYSNNYSANSYTYDTYTNNSYGLNSKIIVPNNSVISGNYVYNEKLDSNKVTIIDIMTKKVLTNKESTEKYTFSSVDNAAYYVASYVAFKVDLKDTGNGNANVLSYNIIANEALEFDNITSENIQNRNIEYYTNQGYISLFLCAYDNNGILLSVAVESLGQLYTGVIPVTKPVQSN